MSQRALIVDDDASIRRVVKRMLEKLAFTVELASCAAEATAAAGTQRFALVLLDMQLPDLDGCLAAVAIRVAAGSPGPAIVIMSGGMAPGTHERALAAGARGCLAKPFTLDALRAVVTESTAGSLRPAPSEDPDPTALLETAAGDDEMLARLVETFLRDAEKHVAALVLARASDDTTAARRRLHQLLGAAGMVGATNLAAMARKLHDDATDAPTVEALAAELTRVASSLRALCDR